MSKQLPTTDSPDSIDDKPARFRAKNAEQANQLAELLQRIRELEARLAEDGHNSSKPRLWTPSSRSRRHDYCRKAFGRLNS